MPDSPRLRQGRKVPEHVYLMLGPEPSDDDAPLVTLPSADLARWLVAAVELAEANANNFGNRHVRAFNAYRLAREAIR